MKHPKKEKPMSKRALKALKKSIKKWEDILAGTGVDEGSDNCALCDLYNRDEQTESWLCMPCPVFQKTDIKFCEGTPCQTWSDHHFNKHHSLGGATRRTECDRCRRLADSEVDFLKSLLPEE